jgi:hypothetical protein
MGDDQGAEAAGVGQGAGEDAGVRRHRVAVGEGYGARVAKERELGHLAPLAALGERRHGQDADGAVLARAAGHELERLGRVDGGGRVGAGDDGRDAPGGGGEAGGAERLLVALAGLADLDAPVHDAGGEGLPSPSMTRRRCPPGSGGGGRR